MPSLLFLALIANVTPAPAVVAHDLAGRYRGAIEIPGKPLEIDVSLEEKNSTWSAKISIPAQNLRDFALSDVKIAPPEISFAMAGIPGDPRFAGKADKDTIAGSFTQGAGSFPFTLKKMRPKELVDSVLKDLDGTVAQALNDFKVPGVAIAIVKDGEVILSKGYGQRDVEKKLPVTNKTLFAIGSTTKAFTTVLMEQLVEEGKLDWNTPVRRYLPSFTLKDEYASSHLTPRDLVTHVSGLPRHDLAWYNNLSLTREELMKRLAYMEPNKSFREEFQYNNMMFMVAGLLVEKVTNKPWEQNVKERIFTPLKMSHSDFTVRDAQKDADHAEPYAERQDVITHIPFRDVTTAGPAGAINSCSDDMARWMLMHLEGGTVDGKKVLLAGSIADLQTPRAAIAQPADDAAVPVATYASGWMVDAYRGYRRVHHGGAIDGFIANVALFPDQHLGIVIMGNMERTMLPGTLTKHIADRILALPFRDWLAESRARRNQAIAVTKEAKANKTATRVAGTHPGHALADYAGRYLNSGYGPVDVELKGDVLVATYNGIKMPLEHWHYDVFRSAEQKEEPDFEGMLLNFRTNGNGEIDVVDIPLEVTVADIRFERQPDARLSDPAFLARLAGTYEIGGKPVTVELRTNVLMISQAGQPAVELVPRRGLAFGLKGIGVVRIEFVVDKDGKATEMKVSDPNGMVTAHRK